MVFLTKPLYPREHPKNVLKERPQQEGLSVLPLFGRLWSSTIKHRHWFKKKKVHWTTSGRLPFRSLRSRVPPWRNRQVRLASRPTRAVRHGPTRNEDTQRPKRGETMDPEINSWNKSSFRGEEDLNESFCFSNGTHYIHYTINLSILLLARLLSNLEWSGNRKVRFARKLRAVFRSVATW